MAAEMNDRRELVLKLVIQEFIENPLTPVASELLVRKYGMNVSSATIRNEMAALEDLGYLTHSHTSAGRVPTDAGYRNLEKIAWAIGEQFGGLVTCHLIVASEKMPSLRFPGKVFLDPDLSVHQTYCADSECLYLIRPDGYIGFRAQPAKLGPVEDHLNKIIKVAKVQSK